MRNGARLILSLAIPFTVFAANRFAGTWKMTGENATFKELATAGDHR